MNTRGPLSCAAIGLVGMVLAVTSGCVPLGSWSQVWHERTVDRQVPRGTASVLDVQTTAGAIEIAGGRTNDVSVIATIRAGAPTEAEAQELAEQVEIQVEPTGQALRVRAAKPALTSGRSIQVSYVIASPRRIDIRCDSSYGALTISNIAGTVSGKTSNGAIRVRDIEGPADLHSSYGSITCRNVAGQTIKLHSSNGSIAASDIQGSADFESSYGAVTCERFSDGDLRLRSGNGRVAVVDSSFGKCEARSSYGQVGGNHLRGESIELKSSSGGVELIDAEAGMVSLSSSYGRVKAEQIVTPELTAHSGKGNMHIAYGPTAPGDLHAEVTSGYGDIGFIAPPGFSGEVALSTDYGSVRTALPVLMTGEISKKKVTGRIGDGPGSIRLKTSNGSIDLK